MLTEQVISAQVDELRAYQGGFFKLLISPEQTGGSLSLVDMTVPKGAAPPRHVHTREDETFYVMEGTIRFEVGDEVITAEAGQAVFAPRNVEHQFFIESAHARMLTLLTPGDFANYFVEFSEPIAEAPKTLQAPQGPPPAEVLAQWVARLNGGYGVHFV